MIVDLYFLIAAVIVQIFIPTAELATPAGAANNEVNAEIETKQKQKQKIFKVIQSPTQFSMLFTH